MELRHLRYFVAVAEELHFRRAAERLHMSQPPLSQQIRQLEEELGVRLLERSRRGVELTAAGDALYERAREVLAAVEDAGRLVRRVNRGEVGGLSVGFVGSGMYTLVPGVLRAFSAHHPDVDLHLRELTTAAQLRQLESGQIDVGFVRAVSGPDRLAIETVLREPVVVALPEGHRLAGEERLGLAQLRGERLVLLTREGSPGMRDALGGVVDQLGEDAPVQEVREMQTVVGLVAAGIGISLVPDSVRSLGRHGVTYRELAAGPTVELAMAWRADDRSPVLAAFRAVVRERRDGPRQGERERREPAPR
jgi:DNA-binding transcriptional LysR family regulator